MLMPPDPRHRPRTDDYTWTSVFALVAAVGLVPMALLLLSAPLLGTLLLAAVTAGVVAVVRTARALQCLRRCGGFAVELGERVQVCVVRPNADATCSAS